MACQVVKAIEGNGGKAVAVKADVSKLEDVTALFKQAAEAFPDEKIEVGHKRKQSCIYNPNVRQPVACTPPFAYTGGDLARPQSNVMCNFGHMCRVEGSLLRLGGRRMWIRCSMSRFVVGAWLLTGSCGVVIQGRLCRHLDAG